MRHRSWFIRFATVASLATLAFAAPVPAAGLHREEQGAKGTALAQAFIAQADDPSAVYYNPAVLSFAADRAFALGFGLAVANKADFDGADPTPGLGTGGERRVEPEPWPHVYWSEPVARRWAVGIGFHSSLGFETEWKQADDWAGRFISRHAELRSWDLDVAASRRIGSDWAVAAGVIVRHSKLSWERSESVVDPTTMRSVEVGLSSVASSGDIGVGAVLALAHRPHGRWSWGVRWRSAFATDLGGDALYSQRPTGDPVVDQIADATYPFDSPVAWSARLRFPERLTVGVAFAPTTILRLELALDHSDWSDTSSMVLTFAGQAVPDRKPLNDWRARTATRLGLRWNGLGNGEWRAGLFHDPTPQPLSDVGPFFVGADRFGASIGYGTRVRRLQTDLALVLEEHETRTAANGFNGTYRTRLFRALLSFGW